MIQADILDLIQKHGFTFPEDVVDKIATVNEKIWKQSQLVTAALIRALIQDFYRYKNSQTVGLENRWWKNKYRIHLLCECKFSQINFKNKRSVSFDNLGWRNKHKIHLLSDEKLSQRTVYKEWGVIDLLVKSDFIEKRKATSTWGNQDFHYRLNLDFLPKAPTLIEALRLFIEGSDE